MQTYKQKHKSKMLENKASKLLEKAKIQEKNRIKYKKVNQIYQQEYIDNKLPTIKF